jgi:hypothetical protein
MAVSRLKKTVPYRKTALHYCDENKAFAPIGTPLATN